MDQHGGPVRVGSEKDNKHSRMGVASFVIGVLTTVLLVAFVVVVGILGRQITGADPQSVTPQDLQRNLQNSPGAVGVLGVAGFVFLASPLLYLIGLGLGIAGLVQRLRRKLFAGLGTGLNGLALLALVALIVLGVVLSRSL